MSEGSMGVDESRRGDGEDGEDGEGAQCRAWAT